MDGVLSLQCVPSRHRAIDVIVSLSFMYFASLFFYILDEPHCLRIAILAIGVRSAEVEVC